jgi:CSLREA domain-containing protein
MKGIARLCSVFLLLSLLLAGQGIRPAYALTYTVNTLNDVDDGTCDATHCSLREAINAANASSADDTITFSVSGTITLGSTLPNIVNAATAGALTIDGGGDITISGNNSVRVMYVHSGANLTLQNLTIANGNSGTYGGGIENYGTLTVINATFSNNNGTGFSSGGGIYNDGTLIVINATFSNNGTAFGGGGGIYNNSGTLTVTNSTFSGNDAGAGGGIANASGTLTVINSTFSANSAIGNGGAIANGGTATIRNTILANSPSGGDCWNDTAGGAILNGGNNIIETNSGCSGVATITSDPNLGALTGSPAYFPLKPGSPAIDAGDNATCAATDQRGVARPNGASCDIGSYEFSPQTYIVNTTDDNTNNDAFCTLREAIRAANNAPVNANCGPDSSANDVITFSVSGTITLGSTLPNIVSAATAGALTINGAGQTVTISGNNSVRVMYINTGANLTLQNLTIANGNSANEGGGIYNFLGTLTVTNVTFSGNSAGTNGGGIYSVVGPLTVTNSTFSGNSAVQNGGGIFNAGTLNVTNSTFSSNSANYGGGIRNDNGTLTVTSSTFSNNSATYGAGIDNYNGTLTVTGSTFSNNAASWDSGGIFNQAGTTTVTNSTFSGNSANYGGGIDNFGGTLTVTNSTFSGNSASTWGGAIFNWKGVAATAPTTTIRNTILANSPSGGDCWNDTAGGAILNGGNNLIETNVGCGSIATITSDPNLDTLTGSPAYFPLKPGSPAIDTGDNATCAATDQRGVSRPKDGDGNGSAICDIGAFEKGSLQVFLPLVVR